MKKNLPSSNEFTASEKLLPYDLHAMPIFFFILQQRPEYAGFVLRRGYFPL